MHHLPSTATHFLKCKEAGSLKKKKKPRGSRCLSRPRLSEAWDSLEQELCFSWHRRSVNWDISGKTESKKSGATLHKVSAPVELGPGVRQGGVRAPSNRWMALSSERKETRRQTNLKPQIACEEIIEGKTRAHQLERKIEKARTERPGTDCPASAATHLNQRQDVPEVAKKLGLQPERGGWENRYSPWFVFFLLPLWFLHLSTHHLHVGLQGTEST